MNWMDLMEPHKVQLLIENHREQQPRKGRNEIDFEPVVKMFVPWGAATWLLTEAAPDGLAFGLCDMGFGQPELGYVSLDEVASIRGPGGITVEQDIHFEADKTLSGYAEAAQKLGRIDA